MPSSQAIPAFGGTCALRYAVSGVGGQVATACPSPKDWKQNQTGRCTVDSPGWISNAIFHDEPNTVLNCWDRAAAVGIVR